jgi:hypothetical protein
MEEDSLSLSLSSLSLSIHLQHWGVNSVSEVGTLSLEPLHLTFFVLGVLEIGSHELFAQDRLQTAILLISDSSVARITGVSHWCPACLIIFYGTGL